MINVLSKAASVKNVFVVEALCSDHCEYDVFCILVHKTYNISIIYFFPF